MARIQTRARTVDMLGRQQIATVQNALAELFKNAYDAEAARVQADYLCGHGTQGSDILCVRDDGIGMTKDDFINKWLVIGTDNKATDVGIRRSSRYDRIITGEKGIGRLAIALLGRQVVIATRALRENGLCELVVAWIHWGLFEIPGINLEDIDIPVETFPGGYLPDAVELEVMRSLLLDNIHPSSAAAQRAPDVCERIRKEIQSFSPSFRGEDQFLRALTDGNNLSLSEEGHGTFFQIGNVNETIRTEIEGERDFQDHRFRKLLLGFYDSVFREANSRFVCSFKYWDQGSFVGDELLADESFISREELWQGMDHLIDGTVDSDGTFSGIVRYYGDKQVNVTIKTQQAQTIKRLECGKFRVVIGCLQKKTSESHVARRDSALYERISSKLESLGGIYVYRDNIRILPYGDTDVDWLEVEKRRSLRAGQYFFSNRNMFGAVLLTAEDNAKLQEKAGREGLQKNLAYRQLRETMISILKQLAVDFFNKNGEGSSAEYNRIKKELLSVEERVSERIKRVQRREQRFVREIEHFFDCYNLGVFKTDVDYAVKQWSDIISGLNSDTSVDEWLQTEKKAGDRIREIEVSVAIKRPRNLVLSEETSRLWVAYQKAHAKLVIDVFRPAYAVLARQVDTRMSKADAVVGRENRLREFVEDSFVQAKNRLTQIKKEISDISRSIAAHGTQLADEVEAKTEALHDEVLQLGAETFPSIAKEGMVSVESFRAEWRDKIENQTEREFSRLDSYVSSLESCLRGAEQGNAFEQNPLPMLEKKIIDLQNQSEQDFSMVQLGVAVAIINHEFVSTLMRIRQGLRSLQEMARTNKTLERSSIRLINDFAHLDGYLRLFSPLQRRLEIKRSVITGRELKRYIESVFVARFVRDKIVLTVAHTFLSREIECYTSTIYPVLINLIDNACYWLSYVGGQRRIVLDVNDDGIIVANTSEPIRFEDRERIFERGFSRKPSGRGLGLHIARMALAAEGYDILLMDHAPLNCNVAFLIKIPKVQDGQEVSK